MKSYNQAVEKAIQIADTNVGAYVGVFIRRRAFESSMINGDGVFNAATRTYLSKSTGAVKFIDSNVNMQDIQGFQFSHIFICGDMTYEQMNFLRIRLISRHTFDEPMGIYYMSGIVEHYESW